MKKVEMKPNKPLQIAYSGNGMRWLMTVHPDGKITTVCNGENRTYKIDDPIKEVARDNEYVFVYIEGGNYYQFKFEENNFLVGDIYDKDGEFVDTYACHVFGED